MNSVALNILDVMECCGSEAVQGIILDFSTRKLEQTLNPDIEEFLKKNAIQFAKEKKSVTYLVTDENDGALLGYFTLAHKAIEIPTTGLSNTVIKKIEKYSQLNEELGVYTVSAFLIAQFGKN